MRAVQGGHGNMISRRRRLLSGTFLAAVAAAGVCATGARAADAEA